MTLDPFALFDAWFAEAQANEINDPNAVIEGSIKYRGRELLGLPAAAMRKLRGLEEKLK